MLNIKCVCKAGGAWDKSVVIVAVPMRGEGTSTAGASQAPLTHTNRDTVPRANLKGPETQRCTYLVAHKEELQCAVC